MNSQSATLHALLVMGLTATPLLCVSPAAAQDVAASAVAGLPSSLPVLAEHRYRMLAKVRPLLFWISRDDVGGARITWRGDRASASGYELLIGSDPAKAPRQINRWGYIAEEMRGSNASVLGVMKQSNEKSIEDAQAQLNAPGNYVFKAIRASAAASNTTAGVTTVRATRDFTYHDLGALLQLISEAQPDCTRKTATVPAGGRAGFLLALADLIQRSVDTRATASKPLTVPYIYNGASHDLTLRHAEYRRADEIGTRRYNDVIRGDFETRSQATGDVTHFEVTYGTTGDLAGVPVHAIYQPRWWFEVQLFLNDAAQF
jgi:hypothetical protein